MLFIFSGLPGVGKTTLARMLAKELKAAYVRIDTIEQCMKNSQITLHYDESYQVAFALTAENLKLGLSVVADSTNPVEESRRQWWKIAKECKKPYFDIEVICSDINEHRQRVEHRETDIPNLKLPTWGSVCEREYKSWEQTKRIVVDTAHKTERQSFNELYSAITLR